MIRIFFNDEQIIKYLKQKGYKIVKNDKTLKAIEKARKDRTEQVKKRIKQVVMELQEKGEEINPYRVSKIAGVNYRTVRKYWKEIYPYI